jgi:hypothetical protein
MDLPTYVAIAEVLVEHDRLIDIETTLKCSLYEGPIG